MKKVFVSFLLILTLIFTLGACSEKESKPEEEKREANPASDFEYHVGEETVSIKSYKGDSKDVVIPEKIEELPVNFIQVCAFAGTDIESVDIPDTVIAIGHNAFHSCKKLHTVKMGNGVETVYDEAFKNCESLVILKLSSKLSEAGTAAFSGCTSLKELHIPKSFNKWYSEVFYNNSISKLTFEDGIENIGGYATLWDRETALKEVTFPASVKKLGEWTFGGGVEHAYFLGDAPEFGKKPFGESKVTIHYKKGTKGWDNTGLEEWYTLVED